jgi:hypothetical protein
MKNLYLTNANVMKLTRIAHLWALFLLCWLLLPSNTQAQFDPKAVWIETMTSPGRTMGTKVATDASGNIFVCGVFTTGVTFGSGSPVPSPSISQQVFIVKYAPDGTVLWSKVIDNNDKYNAIGSIAVHQPTGDVYVVGSYECEPNTSSELFFGDAIIVGSWATSLGLTHDIWISRIDGSTGTTKWIVSGGTENNDVGESITVDDAGNAYITGYYDSWNIAPHSNYNSELSFGPKPQTTDGVGLVGAVRTNYVPFRHNSSSVYASEWDIYVARLGAADGNCDWITVGGPRPYNYNPITGANAKASGTYSLDRGTSISVNRLGTEVYITGEYDAAFSSDNQLIFIESASNTSQSVPYGLNLGSQDRFLTRLNATNGVPNWVKNYGTPGSDGETGSISLGEPGMLYVSGRFPDLTSTFRPLPSTPSPSAGTEYGYVSKFSTGDGRAQWVRTIGGSSMAFVNDIKTNNIGVSHISGSFRGTVSLGSGPTAKSMSSIGDFDWFVGRMKSNGDIEYAISGGSMDDDSPSSIATYNCEVYVTGEMKGSPFTFAGNSVSLPIDVSEGLLVRLHDGPGPIVITPEAGYPGSLCAHNRLELRASIATPPGPISYEWLPNLNGLPTGALSPMAAITPNTDGSETYTVKATTSLGCTNTASITITVEPELVVDVDAVENVCPAGASNGSITLSASGGTGGPYQYSVNNGLSYSGFSTFGGLDDGLRNVKARAASNPNFCQSLPLAVPLLSAPPEAGAPTITTTTICEGDEVDIEVIGAVGRIRWQRSHDCVAPFIDIPGPLAERRIFDTGPLTSTVCFKTRAFAGSCTPDESDIIRINVTPGAIAGTVGASAPRICRGTPLGLTVIGSRGMVEWERSDDCTGSYVVFASGPSTSVSAFATPGEYCFRTKVSVAGCLPEFSDSVRIEFNERPAVPTASLAPATVCQGELNIPFAVTLDPSVSRYNWFDGPGGPALSMMAVPTSPSVTYDFDRAASGITYNINVTAENLCGVSAPLVIPVTVNGPIAGTASTPRAIVCAGENVNLNLVGHTGAVQWQSAATCASAFNNIVGAITPSYTVVGVSAATCFRAIVTDGSCAPAFSNALPVAVSAPPVASALAPASATVCPGTNSTILNLTPGFSGAIIRWESSIDGFTTARPIAHALPSFTAINVPITTSFRAIIGRPGCPEVASGVATITVGSGAGTTSGDASFCGTSPSGLIRLTGHTGPIVRWERSTDCVNFTAPAIIPGALSATLNYSGLTTTTCFRAIVNTSFCAAAGSSVTRIVVGAPTLGGTITSSASVVCMGSNSGTLTLSGQRGDILWWESSANGFATSTTIAATTNTIDFINLAANTRYRARVFNPGCAALYSPAREIAVQLPAVSGSISPVSQSICDGRPATIIVTGAVGSFIGWQTSTDGFATSTPLAITRNWHTFTGLPAGTTQVRAIVQRGVCPAVKTAIAEINVDAPTVAGSVTPNRFICGTSNVGSVSLSGHFGTIVRWESSLDNFVTASPIVNNTTIQNYINLPVFTAFRAIVKNGGCDEFASSPARIMVMAEPVAGTLSGAAVYCSPINTGLLTLSSFSGAIRRWESSTDGFVTITSIANTTPSFRYINVPVSTQYRAVVGNPGCPNIFSNVVEVTVSSPASPAGITAFASAICAGNSANLSLSTIGGTVTRWERQDNCSGAFVTIVGPPTSTLITGPLRNTTCFRAFTRLGSCAEVASVVQRIEVSKLGISGVDVRPVSCSTLTDGQIVINTSGSVSPISYSITGYPSQASNTFSGLPAGSYVVTVEEPSIGCIATTGPVVVRGAGTPIVINATRYDIACGGSGLGAIDVMVSGGVAPYGYVWSNGTRSEDATSLPVGSYTVTVTDANGCSATRTESIVNSSTLTINVSSLSSPSCHGAATGAVTLTAIGGRAPYAFNWLDGVSGSTRTGMRAGTYTAVVEDADRCRITQVVTLTEPTPIVISFVPTLVPCPGNASGAITTTVSGGTGTVYGYLWNDGVTTANRSGLVAGTYVVTVSDALACRQTGSVVISAINAGPAAPVLTSASINQCGTAAVNLSVTPVVGTTYNWYSAPTITSPFATGNSTTIVPFIGSTTYYVEAEVAGCQSVRSIAMVEASALSIGGTISGTRTVCGLPNTGVVSVSGQTGIVTGWEYSEDSWATVVPIASTASSLVYTDLTTTRAYRAIVQNGACSAVRSAVATITVTTGACPVITVAGTTSIDLGTIDLSCGTLPVQSFDLSAVNLSAPLVVDAPTGFMISTSSGSGFGHSISFTPVGGSVATRRIYVRVDNSLAPGSYSGNINVSSASATTQTVAVRVITVPTATPSVRTFPAMADLGSTRVGVASRPITIEVELSYLSSGTVDVSVPAPFEVSSIPSGPYSNLVTLSGAPCAVSRVKVYVRVTPAAVGPFSGTLSFTGGATASASLTGRAINPTQSRTFVGCSWGSQSDVDAHFGAGVNNWLVNAFPSLPLAIDETVDGGIVTVINTICINDNTVVDRPMVIEGAGAGTVIRPTGTLRNGFSDVDPADALDVGRGFVHGFIIRNSEIIIRNLVIDGDASQPCERRFGTGIITDHRTGTPYNDIRIENVTVRNVYAKGIQFYNSGDRHRITNSRVSDVCLGSSTDSLTAANAAAIYSNDPINIEGNVLSNAGTGVMVTGEIGTSGPRSSIANNQISNIFYSAIRIDGQSSYGRVNLSVRGNVINGVGRSGIEAWGLNRLAEIGGASAAEGNRIVMNTLPGRGPAVGIIVAQSSGLSVTSNQVSAQGLESGIHLFRTPDISDRVVLKDNFFAKTDGFAAGHKFGQATGVFLSDRGAFVGLSDNRPAYAALLGGEVKGFNFGIHTNENALADVDLEIGGPDGNIEIDGNHTGVVINGRSAVRVKKNAKSIKNSDVGVLVWSGEADITNNTFLNNRVAILIRDKAGFTALPTLAFIRSNRFIGNREFNIKNESRTTVDASWNYFGTPVRSGVLAKLDGGPTGVDYSPWMNADVDEDGSLDNGFDGDLTMVYVDKSSKKSGPSSHISEAVSDPRVKTVFVVDGTYDEVATINSTVTFTNDGTAPAPVIGGLNMASAASNLTLAQNFELRDRLILDEGIITVDSGKLLTALAGSSIAAGNAKSYVKGAFGHQVTASTPVTLSYPIGGKAFRPASLGLTQSAGSANVYVGAVVEPNRLSALLPPTATDASKARFFNFYTVGSTAFSGTNLSVSYGTDDIGGASAADLTILADPAGTGTMFEDLGGTAVGVPTGSISTTKPYTALRPIVVGLTRGSAPSSGTVPVVTAVTDITTTSALVHWTGVSCGSPLSYEVRYRVKGSDAWITRMGVGSTLINLSGLGNSTTYEVGVRAICGGSVSGWSTGRVTEFRTADMAACSDVTAPAPRPGGVYVRSITATSAEVNWSLVTEASTQGYIVSWGPPTLSPIAWTQVNVCHPSSSYRITGLIPGRTYSVRVRTNCSNCTTALDITNKRSTWTPIVNFSTATIKAGLEDAVSSGTHCAVYPNPNNGQFVVSFEAAESGYAQVSLIDLTGRTVMSQSYATAAGTNDLQVHLLGYAAGVYLLKVQTGQFEEMIKVVVE